MKNSYPIVLTPEEKGFLVYIPDFNINTQGDNLTEAIEMARDAIGLMGIDMQDDNEVIPPPSPVSAVKTKNNEITSLVDVDFDKYRMSHELKSVRKNCTIPGWLNFEAEKNNINFSAVLQEALIEKLRISI